MKEYIAVVVLDKQHRVTIPKAIRDLNGLKTGDTVEIAIRMLEKKDVEQVASCSV